jgi:hypothetical protein
MGERSKDTTGRKAGAAERVSAVWRVTRALAVCASAGLFLLTLLAWGRSYVMRDVGWRPHSEGGAAWQSFRGKVHVVTSASVDPTRGRGRTREPLTRDATWDIGLAEYPQRPVWVLGFHVGQYWADTGRLGQWRSYWFIVIPYWAIALLAAAAPATWLVRRRIGHGRYGRGRCRQCGYDLRASQDRCPECGTPRFRGPWQEFWGRF